MTVFGWFMIICEGLVAVAYIMVVVVVVEH